MNLYALVRWAHIGAGCLSLSTFWIPLVTTKGGSIHRRSGWIYVAATAVAAASGALLAMRYLLDDRPENDSAGFFLLFVGLLGATTTSMGVRALATKARTAAHRNAWDLGLPSLLLAGGTVLAAYGVARRELLFVLFGAFGALLAYGQLRFWTRPPASRKEWWLQHMSGMGGSCIGTVTAFLVVNSHWLGLGIFDVVVWTAPGVAGGIGLTLWTRRYRARFARAPGSVA